MRRLLPMTALLLAYVMTPAAFELTENAVHLLSHADTAHSSPDSAEHNPSHSEDREDDEHGCSGTYHACTCHSSPQFVSSSVLLQLAATVPATCTIAPVTATALASGFAPSIDRPPQA